MDRFEQALQDIYDADPDLELAFNDVKMDAGEIADENVKSLEDVKADITDIVYPELEEDLIAQIEDNGGANAPDALKEKAAETAVEAAVSQGVHKYIAQRGGKAWNAILSGEGPAPAPAAKGGKKKATPGGGRGSQSSKGRGPGRGSQSSKGRKAGGGGGGGAFAGRPMTMRPPSDSSINTQQAELVQASGAQFALADAAAAAIQGNAQAGLRKTGLNGGGTKPGILTKGGGGGGIPRKNTGGARKNSGGMNRGAGGARKNSGGMNRGAGGAGGARKNSGGMQRGRGGSQGRPGHQRSGSDARRKLGAISNANAVSAGLGADPGMALADAIAGGNGGASEAIAEGRASLGRKRGPSKGSVGRSAGSSMARSAGDDEEQGLGLQNVGGGGGGAAMTEEDRVAARKARARNRSRTNSAGRRKN